MLDLPLTHAFDLPPFSAVDLSAGVDATITSGPPPRVTASAHHAEAFNRLSIEVRGDTLFASIHNGFIGLGWFGAGPVHLEITAPKIERVITDAAARATLEGSALDRVEISAGAGSFFAPSGLAGGQPEAGASGLGRGD